MPIKKLRRSYRTSLKDKEVCKVPFAQDEGQCSVLGYFELIPLELRFRVFQFLTVEDLSMMTITSKSMRNLIEGYRVTRFSGPHYINFDDLHTPRPLEEQAEQLHKFQKLGLLMKRTTCLYATKERLKILNEFLTRMTCPNVNSCQEMSRCIALLCYGKFLHTIIAGWDDTECQRVYESIYHHMCMEKQVRTVVSNKPGCHRHIEKKLRVFYRRVFLDPCNTVSEKAFWITRILKPWPFVFQSRLLYLLYTGNYSDGEIQWNEMSESTPSDKENFMQFYGALSSILQILYLHSDEWTPDEVVCIIDEMITGTPEDWLVENIGGLLLSCGEDITVKILSSKAINGRYVEVASIIASLFLVCVKYQHGSTMSEVMEILTSILKVIENPKNRLSMLNRISDTFKEFILDTHEYTDSDDANEADFYHHVSALTEFSKQMTKVASKFLIVYK